MPRKKREDAPSDRVRVQHMLLAAREAVTFSEGREQQDLTTDRVLMRALIHAIAEIGEAARNVSPTARARAPQIEWDDICKMRNFMVHVYWGIDKDRLWATVLTDLPPLVVALEAMLGSWPDASESS